MEALVYSTDKETAKKLIVAKTCAACKSNPLMRDCVCNAEMSDIAHPTCIIVHQEIMKIFPNA